MLPPIQHLLDGIAPAVDLDASQISICDTPDEFYQLLLSMIRSATQRIFLSTLYIGKSEQELVCLSTPRTSLSSSARNG
jgi:CDP-diacylglycerol--glycerol-3-phosphate 3-phosphatidyltransferase